MIQAVTRDPDGELGEVVLGLLPRHWGRMRSGETLRVRLTDVHPNLPDLTVVLVGGDTESAILEDLRPLHLVHGGDTDDR